LAHPYRYADTVPDVVLAGRVDGQEALSHHILNHAAERAAALACQTGAWVTAASDAHHTSMLGHYALDFEAPVDDEADLIAALQARRYSLYVNREMVAAENAWLSAHLARVQALVAAGRTDREIRDEIRIWAAPPCAAFAKGATCFMPECAPAGRLDRISREGMPSARRCARSPHWPRFHRGISSANGILALCWLTYAPTIWPREPGGGAARAGGRSRLEPDGLGAVGLGFYWVYAAGQLVNGSLGDRLSARRFVAVGLLCSAYSTCCWARAAFRPRPAPLGTQRLGPVHRLGTSPQNALALVPAAGAWPDHGAL
jgi:hypothetical protein